MTINEMDVRLALVWVKKMQEIKPCKELETLKDLCERNIPAPTVLYTENDGIDISGNIIHFKSEQDCPRCGHAIKTWRPYCENCGQRLLIKENNYNGKNE